MKYTLRILVVTETVLLTKKNTGDSVETSKSKMYKKQNETKEDVRHERQR